MPLSRSAEAELDRLTALPFAHRGLHGGGRIENSRAAVEAAVAAGHGVEIDVRASRDGGVFVFHDATLDRLTAERGELAERSSAALQAIRLAGSEETVPALVDILRLVGGRAPVLVEVKSPARRVARLCSAVYRSMEGYRGSVGVMSFNPEVPRWFGRNAPRVPRGLVVSESDRRGVRGRIERTLALWRARPHFLACDIRDLPSRLAARRRRRGMPILTWTVRSDEERERAALHADQIIYEVPPA